MTTITASMVKELRDKTGAGMMDCKKALAESGGDMEQAVDELRKRGQAIANKKGARATKEGLIFEKVVGNVGVLVELSCETDFVARNEAFLELGHGLTEIVHGDAAFASGDVEQLKAYTCPTKGKPVGEVLTEAIATIGENMGIARYARVQADGDASRIFSYIHPPGKIGVLVTLSAGKPETVNAPAFEQLGRDLTMQVAAAAPLALTRDEIPEAAVQRERKIYTEQVKEEGKPEKIWDKIVDGKMNKFFKESCLLDQVFVKDQDLTIAKLLTQVGKELDDELKICGFVRFAVGEAAENEND